MNYLDQAKLDFIMLFCDVVLSKNCVKLEIQIYLDTKRNGYYFHIVNIRSSQQILFKKTGFHKNRGEKENETIKAK